MTSKKCPWSRVKPLTTRSPGDLLEEEPLTTNYWYNKETGEEIKDVEGIIQPCVGCGTYHEYGGRKMMSEWKSHITQLRNFLSEDHEDLGLTLLNELENILRDSSTEPDTVSVEEIRKPEVAGTMAECRINRGWNEAIDHLRQQHPTGIKWRS